MQWQKEWHNSVMKTKMHAELPWDEEQFCSSGARAARFPALWMSWGMNGSSLVIRLLYYL